MRRFLLTCCVLTALLGGCNPQHPGASFDPVAVPKAVNLARVLGPQVTLVGPEDTVTLRTNFDQATGLNTFSLPDSGGVLLAARAFRARGLYYLLEPAPHDSGYWVHAVRIRRGQVQGLNTGYRQMAALAAAARQGRWPELVRFSSNAGDSMRLRFEERALRRFYQAQADSSPVYRLQRPEASLQLRRRRGAGEDGGMALTSTLYPNPAHTSTTLEFSNAGSHTVQLYGPTGKVLRTFSSSGRALTLPVDDLPSGTFLVRVQATTTPARPETHRLVVAC